MRRLAFLVLLTVACRPTTPTAAPTADAATTNPRADPELRQELIDPFGAVVSGAEIASLRLHARAWLVALADAGHGDRAVTRGEFAAALVREQEQEPRGRLNPGRWGVVEQSAFDVAFGYASKQGLTFADEVRPRWWLTIAAPNSDELLAKSKRAVKR